MRFTYLLYDPVPDLTELEVRMEHIAALGYQGIELVATYPLGYEVGDLVALAQRLQLPVVSLLSGWSYAHERICFSSPDPTIRRRAMDRLEDYIRFAAPLRAIVVVGLLQGLRSDEPDDFKGRKRIEICLKQVAETAAKHGVTLVLEPVNHMQVGFHNSADEASALVERVNSPALSYMLDTIHMNIEERSLLETIRRHGPRIRHFHLCETNGGPFGTGNLDFPRVLATLEETGYRHGVSVKIYRKAKWNEAALSAAEFLRLSYT